MNKKTIIIISCVAAAVIVIALILILVLTRTKTIVLIKYNENFEVAKTIEIKNKKLSKACAESSLIKDGVPQNIAIENNVKVDLQNGKFFMVQLDLNEYCYYENSNTGTKMIVKMPEGLLDYINELSK